MGYAVKIGREHSGVHPQAQRKGEKGGREVAGRRKLGMTGTVWMEVHFSHEPPPPQYLTIWGWGIGERGGKGLGVWAAPTNG